MICYAYLDQLLVLYARQEARREPIVALVLAAREHLKQNAWLSVPTAGEVPKAPVLGGCVHLRSTPCFREGERPEHLLQVVQLLQGQVQLRVRALLHSVPRGVHGAPVHLRVVQRRNSGESSR